MEGGKNCISVGPWGGQGGHSWDDGLFSTVRQLEITHGSGIDSIKVQYDMNGTPEWSEKHGGSGGGKVDTVKLDYPDEFLTSIHGTYGSMQEWGTLFVRSLTFQSNKRTYGPYGVEQGTYFSFPTTQGKIVGFHGKCGWYLDAIGVHLQPLSKSNPQNSLVHTERSVVHGAERYEYSMIQGNIGKNYDLIVAVRQKGDFRGNPDSLSRQSSDFLSDIISKQSSNSSEASRKEFKNKIVDVPATIERVPSKTAQGVVTYGPWGGQGGTVFDDGIYDGIREIYLSRNVAIVSIRVCYDRHGQPEWGSKNGGTGSYKSDKIVINYPTEILTHITGYYAPAMTVGPTVIRSLTFHTTKGKYGPYGDELGQPFSTRLKDGSIVGIHGRKGLFLDAIGVHVLEGNVIPATSNATPSHPVNQNGVHALEGKVIAAKSKAAPSHIVNQSGVHALEGKVIAAKSNAAPSHIMNQSGVHALEGKVIAAKSNAAPSHIVNQSGVHALEGKVIAAKSNAAPSHPVNQNLVATNQADSSSQWSFKLGKKGLMEEAVQKIVKDPTPYGTGPWGGEGGKPWDDGVFTGIKQIILNRTDAICSIEIEYDRNGQSVWSVKHGGTTTGEAANRVKLEYPHEVLTCISGYYGPLKKDQGTKVLKSLTFHTSRRKIGPYGEELGQFFTSATTEGKVVGFHGRSGMYMDAIGVHMQHWLGNNQRSKPFSLRKMFY